MLQGDISKADIDLSRSNSACWMTAVRTEQTLAEY